MSVDSDPRVGLLRLLMARLERLSVDSIWARRANGLRGSLVRALDAADAGHPYPAAHMDLLIEHSFDILRRAAREIVDAESLWRKIKEAPASGQPNP